MSSAARVFILVAIAVVLVAARTIVPVPSAATGAFGHGPTVVLVHGLGARAGHWLPVARRLARDHRVVLVDLPGHGASPMPASLTLQSATAALDQALAGERRPVTLVGHSLGGLVAAAEACEHPERVQALVLVETALKPPVDEATRAALLARLDHDQDGLLRDTYRDYGRDRRQSAALWAEARAVPPQVMRAWIRLALTTDLSDRASGIECPVTAVFAERSWPPGEPWPSTADTLGFAGIAHVDPVRITGSGHFVMLDRPDTLAAVIARAARGSAPPTLALR
jgi:pimeloyl-ACP methyl ester carboxylesterase